MADPLDCGAVLVGDVKDHPIVYDDGVFLLVGLCLAWLTLATLISRSS